MILCDVPTGDIPSFTANFWNDYKQLATVKLIQAVAIVSNIHPAYVDDLMKWYIIKDNNRRMSYAYQYSIPDEIQYFFTCLLIVKSNITTTDLIKEYKDYKCTIYDINRKTPQKCSFSMNYEGADVNLEEFLKWVSQFPTISHAPHFKNLYSNFFPEIHNATDNNHSKFSIKFNTGDDVRNEYKKRIQEKKLSPKNNNASNAFVEEVKKYRQDNRLKPWADSTIQRYMRPK